VIFAGGAGTAWLAFGGDDEDPNAGIVVPTTVAPLATTSPTTGNIDPAVNEPNAADPHGPIDVNAVATAVAPSVVTISADVDGGFQSGEAVGTGVIVSEDGEIITNAHVVAGASEIRVRLAGNTEPIVAELVATDPGNDLALLRIDLDKPLPAATFANPDDIRLGDHVVAIGFALDLDGDPSVTLGIISALDRTLSESTEIALDGLIQTDAAISSGNSGGPLVNAAGQVVGINTAVARSDAEISASNVGFAISSGEVLQVLEQLRTGDARQEGRLGVGVAPRNDGGQGAIVTQVESGLPAANAGIQVGDIIVQVDESTVTGGAALVAAVRDHSPGDEVSIVLLRNGEPVTLAVTLVGR
jgi:S1-C subfamily serine protease